MRPEGRKESRTASCVPRLRLLGCLDSDRALDPEPEGKAMKKHIALLLGGAELLAAATLGLAVGADPASAAPTETGANLFIAQDPDQLFVATPGIA
jgi:hypothetical protein